MPFSMPFVRLAMQAFNFPCPYAGTGLTPDTSKKIAAVAQRAFQGR
jgi:hypothetical protein